MISIIIPIVRPDKAENCIAAIKENAGDVIYEIVAEVDTKRVGCPEMIKRLVAKTTYDLVMFLGDDTLPQPGFLVEALKCMECLTDGWGVVGLATEDPRGWNEQAHFMAHKKMLEYTGGEFYSTEYRHCYGEEELRDIATEMGRFIFAEKAQILHDHPINGKGKVGDEDLLRAYSGENFNHDQNTYFRRKRERMKKKYGVRLAIALPLTDDKVYNQFFYSFISVLTSYMGYLAENGRPIVVDVLMPDYPGQIDAIRNNFVQQALRIGCTHILFMDTDQMYCTPDMIKRMLDHNKPVLGARVHRRYMPFDPLMLRGEEGALMTLADEEIRNEDGTFKDEVLVDYTGTGCIMYDMKIFNDLFPDKPFRLRTGKQGQPVGEDIGFCTTLKELGIPIYVDASIDIKHLALLATDFGTYKLFRKLLQHKPMHEKASA